MLYFGKERFVNVAKQLGVLLMVFGLMGCAGTGAKTEVKVDAPQDAVAKRAQSRWDALIKGDLDAAYGYLSPGMRSVMSLELYKAKIVPGRWKKAGVDSVACVQDRCDVSIKLEYGYRAIKSIETRLDEVWLQENDEWWFVPRK